MSEEEPPTGDWSPVRRWLLLDGHRLTVTGVVVAAGVAVTYAATTVGPLHVGAESYVATTFASGVVSGLFTLLTVALSVNQLVLSRMMDSPNELRDRLDGTETLRGTVETVADRASGPTDPAEFLSLTASELVDRADGIEAGAADVGDGDLQERLGEFADDLRSYAEPMTDIEEERDRTVDIIPAVLGSNYADCISQTDDLRSERDALPDRVLSDLAATATLLGAIAVTRQFFKTLAIQQDLAELSRRLVALGLPAVVVALFVPMLYTSGTNTGPVLAADLMAPAVSLAVGVALAPLGLLVAYILRAATVSRYTVSVGPFVPPQERAQVGDSS